MIKLMRAPNLMIAQHWINLLEQARIGCELHNRYLQGALGEIPADQCGPEIWLEDERDSALAQRLIGAGTAGAEANGPWWTCNHCQEWLEPQFTICWQCGAARED
jgi:hypothetical protein